MTRICQQRLAMLLPYAAVLIGCSGETVDGNASSPPDADGVRHVRPGEEIQRALEAAAADPVHKTVKVHAGTYRPPRSGQALIWFNARHDGILLEAVGEVVLTAANSDNGKPSDQGYPAVVNHVVYFGDGVSRKTIFRGFKITGSNHFVTRSEGQVSIEPNAESMKLEKGLFFYNDGGAIKVFGRSYPTIDGVELFDNYASPCGGGVSIEHQGHLQDAVTFQNCIFRNNRCQVTGSAIDVLPSSRAVVQNCLFVGNLSNTGEDYVSPAGRGYNQQHGSGALTVFRGSQVSVNRCTFTGNWNGVDDKGRGNIYKDSIFWMNNLSGGISPGGRYEFDIIDGRGVKGCFVHGDINDLRGSIDPAKNVFDSPDPEFDFQFRPLAVQYVAVGYSPATD